AWAVGESNYNNGRATRTLILHWNGTMWKWKPSPNVGFHNNHLSAVSAVSRSNAWAVGGYSDGRTHRTLILHWNGTAWKVWRSPNGATDGGRREVYAVSCSYVWAVGA